MSATPESTLASPEQLIADLERQLVECRAECDEALGERDKAQRTLAERTAERDEALDQPTSPAEEPLAPDSPLWAIEHVLLTRHTAGETRRYEDNVIEILRENLELLWRGEGRLRN